MDKIEEKKYINKILLSFNIFLLLVFIFRIIMEGHIIDLIPTYLSILLSVNITLLLVSNIVLKSNYKDNIIKNYIKIIVFSVPLVIILGILFFNIFSKML